MIFLLDTHILLWVSMQPAKLSSTAREILSEHNHDFCYSVVNIWEIAIKFNLKRRGFNVDPRVLRRGLQDNGYEELPITSDHALTTSNLPLVHGDPFDRMLIAQAMSEGITLLTADRTIGDYPGPIRLV